MTRKHNPAKATQKMIEEFKTLFNDSVEIHVKNEDRGLIFISFDLKNNEIFPRTIYVPIEKFLSVSDEKKDMLNKSCDHQYDQIINKIKECDPKTEFPLLLLCRPIIEKLSLPLDENRADLFVSMKYDPSCSKSKRALS